jgi:predicted ATPase
VESAAPFAGRESELDILRLSLDAAAEAHGSLLLIGGPAGVGKTRLLGEATALAAGRGFTTGTGSALVESRVLYHPWSEALRTLGLDQLLREEPPPRALGLYLVSEAGLPVGRAERPGFGEDPALLSMMLNNAAEFLRDAIRPAAAAPEGDLLRLAVGGRGVVIARAKSVALLAVYEGRETEIFLRELRRLLDDTARRAGDRLDLWDGNKRAVADLQQPLVAFMQSGNFDGVDLAADGTARKFNLFDNVLFGLRRRALIDPVFIVLDDLQWADPSSLGLLHYIARNTLESRVLLVGAFRAEERDLRLPLRDALSALAREDLGQEIALGGLAAEESRALADALIGPHKIDPRFFERLAAETEGNPLIVREVVRQLRLNGAIAPDPEDGLLRITRPLNRLEVTGKVRDAISNRIATLDRADRELLDTAAVCGTKFSGKLLAAAVQESELQVARQLTSIARHHGVVQPAEGAWRFDHPVMREVIYDAIPPDFRRLLHLEVGRALRAQNGDEGDIGEHLALAGDASALEPLQHAARAALDRGAAYEAARLLERATLIAPEGLRLTLEMDRADALERADHYDEALAALKAAESHGADPTRVALMRANIFQIQARFDEVLASVADALPAAGGSNAGRLLTLRARAFIGLSRLGEGEEAAKEALERFGKGDPRGRASALMPLGTAEWHRGRHDRALEIFNEALRLREAAGDRQGVAEVLYGIGSVQGDVGQTQRAYEFLTLALTLCEKIGDRRQAASARLNVANALADLGELDTALEEANRALAAGQSMGNARVSAWSECMVGVIHARRGEARDALVSLERAAQQARKQGELRLLASALAESVAPRLWLGNVTRARHDAEEALRLARQTGLRPYEGVALRALGEVHAAASEFDLMSTSFGQAVDLFSELGNDTEAAETHVRWAEALQGTGRTDEASPHWAKAVDLFESRNLRKRAAVARASIVSIAR